MQVKVIQEQTSNGQLTPMVQTARGRSKSSNRMSRKNINNHGRKKTIVVIESCIMMFVYY